MHIVKEFIVELSDGSIMTIVGTNIDDALVYNGSKQYNFIMERCGGKTMAWKELRRRQGKHRICKLCKKVFTLDKKREEWYMEKGQSIPEMCPYCLREQILSITLKRRMNNENPPE